MGGGTATLEISSLAATTIYEEDSEQNYNDDDTPNATKKQRMMIVFDKDGTLGDCTQSMHAWSKRMTTLLREDLLLRKDTATDRRETTSSITTTIHNFHTVIGWDPQTECLTEDSLLSSGTWQQILDATTNVLVERNLEAETTALQQQQQPSAVASSRERIRTHVERLHASVGEIHADDTPVVAELANVLTELKTQLRTVYATTLDEVLFAMCTSDDRRATTACLHNWNITDLIDVRRVVEYCGQKHIYRRLLLFTCHTETQFEFICVRFFCI